MLAYKRKRGRPPGSKNCTSLDYLAAMNASQQDSYIDIDEVIIACHPNPERALIRKELYENLSENSKTVIGWISSPPKEFKAVIFTPKGKLISCSERWASIDSPKNRIRRYLGKKWGKKESIAVIKEITAFVKEAY